MEFVPVFPPVYASTVPPHAGKNWIDKRLPNCKVSLILARWGVFKAQVSEAYELRNVWGFVDCEGVRKVGGLSGKTPRRRNAVRGGEGRGLLQHLRLSQVTKRQK